MNREPIEYRQISGGKVHIVGPKLWAKQRMYYCGIGVLSATDRRVEAESIDICKTCLRLRAKDEA